MEQIEKIHAYMDWIIMGMMLMAFIYLIIQADKATREDRWDNKK